MLLPSYLPTTFLSKVFLALIALYIINQCRQIQLFPPVHSSSSHVLPVDGNYTWFQDAMKNHAPLNTTVNTVPNGTPQDDSENEDVLPPSNHEDIPPPSKDEDVPPPSKDEDIPPPSRPLDYNQTFVSYGTNQCLPFFDEALKQLASDRNQSCAEYAPFIPQETRRVAFASITTGEKEEAYQRAIESQMFHSAVHGTSTHVLCDQLVDSTFNKIAFLIDLVMNEMLKPERLEWIMWVDRDAIVLDMCRPLSSFLPPDTEEFKDVNLIVNNDGAGLNNGVFLFKVNRWSLELFNTILAYQFYRPDSDLTFAEQSAQEAVMQSEKFKAGTVRVPLYWFNAFPDEDKSVEKYRQGLEPEDLEWYRARKGDFIAHFAGDPGRTSRMVEWENMLMEVGNVWEEVGTKKHNLSVEIERFWKSWKEKTLTESQITGEQKVRIQQQ